MKTLILYSTIVGGFYAKTDLLDQAISRARERVGSDTWKRGYSARDPNGATSSAIAELREANIEQVQFEGELSHVSFVETSDASGNSYMKLRIGVQNLGDEFLMSLDLKGDVAQRLLVKLDNCSPGDYIKVSAWPTIVEKAGRQFINHAASMKTMEGTEIPANSAFSAQVKALTEAVAPVLIAAGIDDKKVIATAKLTKRIEAHKQLLLKIQARFEKELATS